MAVYTYKNRVVTLQEPVQVFTWEVVKRNGRRTGTIERVRGGWQYFVWGEHAGSTAVGTMDEVKRELEEKK